MCRVKCSTEPGMTEMEVLVRFLTTEGTEESVPLSRTLVDESGDPPTFKAYEIARQGNQVLIELPNESFSGRWRHFVSSEELVEQQG